MEHMPLSRRCFFGSLIVSQDIVLQLPEYSRMYKTGYAVCPPIHAYCVGLPLVYCSSRFVRYCFSGNRVTDNVIIDTRFSWFKTKFLLARHTPSVHTCFALVLQNSEKLGNHAFTEAEVTSKKRANSLYHKDLAYFGEWRIRTFEG